MKTENLNSDQADVSGLVAKGAAVEKENIMRIIGFGMPTELVELKADEILRLYSKKEESIKCPYCDGEGYTPEHNPESNDNGEHNCNGCPIPVPCSYCYGNGRVTTELMKEHIKSNQYQLTKSEEDDLPF